MKNVQVLVKEMFKVQNNFSTEIMKNFFPMTEAIHNYNRSMGHLWTTASAATISLNPFLTYVPLLYLPKATENLGFYIIFRGYRGETLVENRLLKVDGRENTLHI